MQFDLPSLLSTLTDALARARIPDDVVETVSAVLVAAVEGRFNDAGAGWADVMRAAERIDMDRFEEWARAWAAIVSSAATGRDPLDTIAPMLAFIEYCLGAMGVFELDVSGEDRDLVDRFARCAGPALDWISDACIETTMNRFGGAS